VIKPWVIFIACAAALVTGGMLSVSDYLASSSTITVTSTQPLTTSATITATSVSTSTVTTQTTTGHPLLQKTLNIPSPGGNYCGMYESAYTTLDPGTYRITFSAGSDPVDFWMLGTNQRSTYVATTTQGCDAVRTISGTVSRMGVTSWDTTVSVSSTDMYYFVFMNSNNDAVSVSLTVSTSSNVQTTEILEATNYLTSSSTWSTQTLAMNQQTQGLSPLFYIGLVLLVAGTVLGYFYSRSHGENERRQLEGGITVPYTPPDLTIEKPEATTVRENEETEVKRTLSEDTAVKIEPSELTTAKRMDDQSVMFCEKCGAKLNRESKYCFECGTKVSDMT
jgi:hypothetical protein